MENMESKSIEEYFSKANKMPLAMSFADVQSLVSAKGVTSPPKKSWWNLKNIIIMTISAILTTAILVYSLSVNTNSDSRYTPNKLTFENNLEIDSEKEIKQLTYIQKPEGNGNVLVSNEVISNIGAEHPKGQLIDLDASTIHNSEQSIFELGEFLKFYNNYSNKNSISIENIGYEEINSISKDPISKIDGETKTVTQSIDAANLKTFVLTNKFGKINVETWSKTTIKVTAHFTLETKSHEDSGKGLEDFKLNLNTEGSNAIVSTNWDNLNNCSDNSNFTSRNKGLFNFLSKNNMKTEEGEKIKFKQFKIEYSIKIPKYFNVNLTNSYGDIELQTIDGIANIEVFQGNLLANDMKELELNLKYGSAEVNNITKGTVEGFQSKLKLGNSEKLKLISKYSTVKIGRVEDLNLEGFQTNLVASGTVKNIEGSWKYGKLELLQDAENVRLVTFQTPFIAQNINSLIINIKYGELTAASINNLELPESFQSKIKITNVGDIKGDLKYSPLQIDLLKNEMDVTTFNGNINVKNIDASFTALNLETKYTNINLRFDPNAKYDLDGEIAFSKLVISDGFVNESERSSGSSNVNYYTGTFNENIAKEASKVYLKSFQGKVVIE